LRHMSNVLSAGALVVAAAAAAAQPAPQPKPPQPAAAQPASAGSAVDPAVRLFRERLDRYVALRLSLEKQVPAAAVEMDVRRLRERGNALADAVRKARADARQGDLFVPEVRPLLVRAITDEIRRDPAVAAALRDGDPTREGGAAVRLQVDAAYPEPAPWSTVPPELLAHLPPLPDDLEYRFAGRTLLLVDTRARVVLDFLPGAAPR
jgi:hypothetical protein